MNNDDHGMSNRWPQDGPRVGGMRPLWMSGPERRSDCLVGLTADELQCEWDGEHAGRRFAVDMPSGYAAFTCATHLAEAVLASLEVDG